MKLITRTEELILLAICQLKEDAYCVPIRQHLSDITQEKWSLGSIYMPLDRLSKKGYLESYLSEATPQRGGRHKRIYKITPYGEKALIQAREVHDAMWAPVKRLPLESNS